MRLLYACCLSVILGAPALARAETAAVGGGEGAPDDETITRAKALYGKGAEAYQEGRYKDAIDLFLEANRTAPLAAFSYNIGVAFEQMGDPARALLWYRDYARRSPEGTDLTEATAKIAALEKVLMDKGVQQVTVLTKPDAATVLVDGRPVGVAPWTGELMPGGHEVELRARGYRDHRSRFELPAHKAVDVSFELEPEAVDVAPPSEGETPYGGSTATAPAAAADRGAGPKISLPTWIALGTGAAALGGAVLFEVLRASAESSVSEAPNAVEGSRRYDTAESHQTVARVLAVAGGVVTVAGGVLLALDLTSPGAPAAGLGLAGAF